MKRLLLSAILAVAIGLVAAHGTRAGSIKLGTLDELGDLQIAEEAELYFRATEMSMPGLISPLIDYSKSSFEDISCDASQEARTFVILVGADDIGYPGSVLVGPRNDVSLLQGIFENHGIAADNIFLNIGDKANREGLSDAFLKVLGQVQCNDRVVVHISSHGIRARSLLGGSRFAPSELLKDTWDARERSKDFEQFSKALSWGYIHERPEVEKFVTELLLPGKDDLVVFLNDNSENFNEVIRGKDISDFMIIVRNRGAHAVAILDMVNAGAANIEGRQLAAGDASSWKFEYSAETSGAKEQDHFLLPGAGDFAVFYAAASDEVTPELPLPRDDPDAQKFGLFTYSLAVAFSEPDALTPRNIAAVIQRLYSSQNRTRPHPRIETSNADLVLVAEKAPRAEDVIRILRPTPKRGVTRIEVPEIEIKGVVDTPAALVSVLFDQTPVQFSKNGYFTGKFPLKNGINRVTISALTTRGAHYRTLEFSYEGSVDALVGQGKRYAVIIANQNYSSQTGFASLATPFADVDALVESLSTEFGFETELQALDGSVVPLILKDQTKREIQAVLHHIGKVAGEKDTVLVYYAGHGVFERDTSLAFWIPRDAEANVWHTYLSADEITAAIKRMHAGNVILISDSCYSGALMRGGPEEESNIEDRRQSLLKMQDARSRILITSGNNTPVEDGGGNGHSIFARALLTGLSKMEHDAFSARELFSDYIVRAVSANAEQEPQFRALERVGHEGGDFVFVRTGSAAMSAD